MGRASRTSQKTGTLVEAVGKTIQDVVPCLIKQECSAAAKIAVGAVQPAPSLDAVQKAVSQVVEPAVAAAVGADSFKTSMKEALGPYFRTALNETSEWIVQNVVSKM